MSFLTVLLLMAESSPESVDSTVLELQREVNEMYRNLLLDEDSQVDAIKARIRKDWPKVVGIPCDVSRSEDVQALSEAAVREFGNVVHCDVLQERNSVRAVNADAAHVRNIEQAGVLPHGVDFGDNTGFVLHGHVPSGERDKLRAGLLMRLVQRRTEQGGIGV